MPDYQEMYLKMFRASEAAANILIEAQRECEQMYIEAPEAELRVLSAQTGGMDEEPRSVT